MDDHAGDVGQLLADRYRLLLSPAEAEDAMQWRAYDTAAEQEVLVRQVPLPEVVEAELVDEEPPSGGGGARGGVAAARRTGGRATRRPADPGVRRALEAALAAARLPDHPRLGQVFDVFVEGDGLWIVSELLPARPLAALLAERPLSPHRAAEIGADLVAALRAVHAQGWTHRNVTARTVLVCDDGHAMLTGLAAGAAEETLCGYDVLPRPAPPAGGKGGPTASGAGGAHPGAVRDGASAPPAGGEGGPRPSDGLAASASGSAAPDGGAPDLGASRDGGSAVSPGGKTGTGPDEGPAASGGDRGTPDRGSGTSNDGFAARDGWAVPPVGGEDGPGRGAVLDASAFGGPPGPEPGTSDRGGAAGAGRSGPPVARETGTRPSAGPATPSGGGAFEGGTSGPGPGVPDGGFAVGDGRFGPPVGGDAGSAASGDGGARDGSSAAAGGGEAGVSGADGEGGGTGGGVEVPGQRAEAAGADGAGWWQVEPVRGAPWDEAHAYGAAEQRPGRPHEGDGPAARAARRGAVAAYHAGTRAAAEHRDDERWPFVPGADTRAATRTDRTSDAGSEWWPFDEPSAGGETPGGTGGEAPGKAQWWPFEDDGDEAGSGRGGGPAAGPGLRSGPRGEAEEWPSAPPDPAEPGAGRGGVRGGTPALPDGWAAAEAEAAPARSALGSERARDARLAAVGAVTERWAPEQAGARQPVGPAADLWALGALLFRAVQGRPPYPEEAAAELVQLVRTRPPESDGGTCGPLQPVVESLLRQDPAQRADVGELRERLLAIVRAAPEPEVGRHTLVGPPSLAPGQPADPRRLPIVRRRGELVRRRRPAKRPKPPAQPKRAKAPKRGTPPLQAKPPAPPPVAHRHRHTAPAAPAPRRAAGSPRRLGRLLVGLVLLLLTGAVLYAMWFMPRQGTSSDNGVRKERSSVGEPAPRDSTAPSRSPGGAGPANTPEPKVSTTQEVPSGFALYDDPSGFRIAVPRGWHRSGVNDRGQVRFDKGDFEMLVVKGRDSTRKFGTDPMAYQSKDEPELQPYRTSHWATASGLRRIDVGGHAMAEGAFTWKDASGREVYVRNRALILDGRYHLVLVIGPADERSRVDHCFESVVDTYRVLRRAPSRPLRQ